MRRRAERCVPDAVEDLTEVETYFWDGNYHKMSTHEQPINGKKWAVDPKVPLPSKSIRTYAVF